MNDVVLVDALNLFFINFHVAKKMVIDSGKTEFTREDLPLFYHIYVSKINSLFENYGKAIICFEGKKSLVYRRSFYDGYKRNRDASKQEPIFQIILEQIPKIEQLLSYYPTKLLKIDECEADDLLFNIAVKYGTQGLKTTIITSDKDLSQALNYSDNIKVFNPVRKSYYEKNENIVLEKIVIGDKSDNIPGIAGIGEKRFEKMMLNEEEYNKVMNKPDNKKILEAFSNIVDLTRIPEKTKQEILDKENFLEYNKFDPDGIEMFFMENKLKQCLEKWGTMKNKIWRTIGENNE
jgi:5'-3' exonuclease